MSFNNSIIEQAFFRLVLEKAISLEEAREILDSYKDNKEDLLFLANEVIDSIEIRKIINARPVPGKKTAQTAVLENTV